ncbi:N-acetyl-D-glucosamine kinase [Eumeta japonica]|uniref:N-acetyl-D-glucosamine kinase n=1 Tax=Eumeta variegata TaxID=151549 RepID=A0A4C1ZQJ2_EUMVA|nr:N-acetyl-D-glucosamine kinase [Eumeta japonica]
MVICDESGRVVGRSHGRGTNHWALGMDECIRRLKDIVHAAKRQAGLPLDKPLHALGLTLSGCEQESSNAELAARLRESDPHCANHLYVASDTAGSLATAAPGGGLVLIAEANSLALFYRSLHPGGCDCRQFLRMCLVGMKRTGSNALLQNPDGQKFGCGGWGYLLGDEGGGESMHSTQIDPSITYWIAFRAVKTVFDHIDGLDTAPHDLTAVWATAKEHFGMDDRPDLLPHCYKHFDKSTFAGLTIKLAELARNGDALSQDLFEAAGMKLGAHVAALAPRIHPELRPLRVVCVGSVWRSWELLKPGMLQTLIERKIDIDLDFVRLRVSSAVGAAWLGAKHAGRVLPRDDAAHCEVLYEHRPSSTPAVNGHAEHC